MMDEPSVLDYIKSKLTFWREDSVQIPKVDVRTEESTQVSDEAHIDDADVRTSLPQTAVVKTRTKQESKEKTISFAWRSVLALSLALIAQLTLEPGPNRSWILGFILYLLAIGILVWANLRGEFKLSPFNSRETYYQQLKISGTSFWFGIIFGLVAFLSLGGNRFTTFNVLVWTLSVIFIMRAFWTPSKDGLSWKERFKKIFALIENDLHLSPWNILLLGAIILVVFFRVYKIQIVPPEMVSDHAEKLLDVWDVLNGEMRIFFPRNTGRESMQMYLTAAVVKIFGTGFSYLSLKIGTILAGLLTLPYIYLIGKEMGNRRAGLLAFVFAGIAYWPNVISRVGLRFPLYPLFVAPTLYYLLRGIRSERLNNFILAGLAMGIGLHGYTPIRMLPFVVILAVGIYLLHKQSSGRRKASLLGLGILLLVFMLVLIPLIRYGLENPEMLFYRSLTRIGTIEQQYPEPVWKVFLKNLWDAGTMFAWDNGEIWVHSITHRPALGVISAALFYPGAALLLLRYIRRRNWFDIFILSSIPLLMMPSILSLAFPGENPSLNRTSGAIVPVFVIVGITGDGLLTTLESRLKANWKKWTVWIAGFFLIVWSSIQNFDLVFNQYQQAYLESSWNTTEMGEVIRDFSNTIGSSNTAWVIAYPHWVDTRLVGLNAGYPLMDYALWPEDIEDTQDISGPKLFLIKPDDQSGQDELHKVYPEGIIKEYQSMVDTKNFLMFTVLDQ